MNENDIRCGACNRKLGEGQFSHLKIKCQRCGTMNSLRATRPIPECHRAPLKESAMNDTDTTTQPTKPIQTPANSGQPVCRNRRV